MSLAMAELHNQRSLSAEYQAAVTMRGELDELYAKMSDIRREMRKLHALSLIHI